MPGRDRSRKASTSPRSRNVPCSSTSPSARRCSRSQRANARAPTSSTAYRRGRMRFGDEDSRMASASPSECAGSVETTSVNPGSASARAAAHVVLPTPPLPPKNRNLIVSLDLDAGDFVFRGHPDGRPMPTLDLADAREDAAFDLGEFGLCDVAELELHLRFEQLLAQRRVVVRLGFGGRDDLVEDEPQAADQHGIQNEHHARSSFNRMFTKLYGGHGPVYLNVSLSNLPAIAFTLASNADSWSREIRNAAFMIILSPIGLLIRDATDTSRSCSRTSDTYRSERAWSAESIRRPYCMRAK